MRRRFLFFSLGILASCQVEPDSPVDYVPEPRGSNFVEFGSDSAFRIGDGSATNTSCADRLSAADQAGTAFEFSFEVIRGTTNVNLRIDDLCGVDFENNVVSLYQEDDQGHRLYLSQKALPVAAQSWEEDFVALPTGQYTVRIESGARWTGPDVDLDDFLVGRVSLSANRNIGSFGGAQALMEPKVSDFWESDELVEFILGDFVGEDSFCEAGEDVTEVSGEALSWDLEVGSESAFVSLALLDLCGVDFGGNFLVIDLESGERREFLLSAMSPQFFPGLNLPRGTHRLRIQSAPEPGGSDRDDFRIRALRFYFNGDLQITSPSPN